MSQLKATRQAIHAKADKAKALHLMRFFKTGKGQYGEGDKFLGLTIPIQRVIAREFRDLSYDDLQALLESPWHEERLVALLILVDRFQKGDEAQQKKAYTFYLKNTAYVNNWDLVDLTAHHIIGGHLDGKDKAVLKRLARSKILWERRIAMVACFYEIRKGKADQALVIAQMLLEEDHDLMHKAVGWMLREVGKRVSRQTLKDFLRMHYTRMPRTALRYAIEHFPEEQRQIYLKGLLR